MPKDSRRHRHGSHWFCAENLYHPPVISCHEFYTDGITTEKTRTMKNLWDD